MLNPSQNGRITYVDPALRHHLAKLPITQLISGIPANTKNDDMIIKMTTVKEIR